MNEKKNIMLKRLEQVIKSDKNMTKDEIMDYVFDSKHANKSITDENNYIDSKVSNKENSPIKDK